MRSEAEIFSELADLCRSPGYAHAIAYFCFRDNMIRYSDQMTAEDMQHMFSSSRLIRAEISTLVGLLLKGEIDYNLPDSRVLQQYMDRTESLLEELHQSMSAPFHEIFDPEKLAQPDFNPFEEGSFLREPIFYSGESAYSFQYRDFSVKKYAQDDGWLLKNKGFTIQDARDVAQSIGRMQDAKSMSTLAGMRSIHPNQWTFLPACSFTEDELAKFSKLELSTVQRVLEAFCASPSEQNSQFNAYHDFNVANPLPIIPVGGGKYINYQIYSLVESIYESPFYWMGADASYIDTAMRNRGQFTEEFSYECLVKVFGKGKVFRGIDVFESKSKRVGEIDVLVLFGDRAIILQAKSKRLTLNARKGHDEKLREDFKKSVQDSYDQALLCAKALKIGKCVLKDGASNVIPMPASLKEIYLLCVVSDHYPALSFQSRQFLKTSAEEGISAPFVMDIFTLDAMSEMLDSPVQMLSYIDRRAKYLEKVVATHELTVLSYHIKQNLWLSDEHDLVMLSDDISADLDLAMLARREGIPAKKTPDGILTRLKGTALWRFVREIEARPDPGTIDLAFMILTMSEDTFIDVSRGIDELSRLAVLDGRGHDLTVAFGKSQVGFTIHCNDKPVEISGPALQRHCHARKYTQRAKEWFGICVSPGDKALRFGIHLNYEWEQSDEADVHTKNMTSASDLSILKTFSGKGLSRKVGRNDPCPCGSGRKFKRCCIGA